MSGSGGATSGTGADSSGGEAGQPGGTPLGTVDPRNGRIAIGSGNTNMCVESGGNIYCWGSDTFGQLGVPPADPAKNGIVRVPGLTAMVGVAVSDDHACALSETGDVYCWGSTERGQTGSDSAPDNPCFTDGFEFHCQPTPTRVEGVSGVVELALASEVSCALLQDGSVRCWGNTNELDPWLGTVGSATSISLGPTGACATLTNGELSCSFEMSAPGQLTGAVRRLELGSAGDVFGCALGTNGDLSCVGDDTLGQLGDGGNAASGPILANVVQVAAGNAHACALLANGELRCWGENWYGAVGGYPLESPNCLRAWRTGVGWSSAATCETTPRTVAGVPPLVAIGANGEQTCGFAADETLWCWGRSAYSYGAPVRVTGPWEAGGDTCASLQSGVVAKNVFTTSVCETDDDCTGFPLDLPCAHTCDVAPISKHDLPYLQADMSTIRDTTCPAMAAADCLSPEVTCSATQKRAVCVEKVCAFDDPARTGCTDSCACALERTSQTTDTVCDGFHLWISYVVNCAQCSGSFVYLAIGNRGASTFDDSIGLNFYERDHEGAATIVPESRTLSLHLGPGEISAPIRVDSRDGGYVDVGIDAPGDCWGPNEGPQGITWEFPSPENVCE